MQLSVVPKEGKDFTLKEVEQGVFEATTAPGNAIIEFAPLKSGELSDDIAVLSFDYFCASGMEFMVVMVNNDHSRIEENMIRMPICRGLEYIFGRCDGQIEKNDRGKRLSEFVDRSQCG